MDCMVYTGLHADHGASPTQQTRPASHTAQQERHVPKTSELSGQILTTLSTQNLTVLSTDIPADLHSS